jgi:hypothetical protein
VRFFGKNCLRRVAALSALLPIPVAGEALGDGGLLPAMGNAKSAFTDIFAPLSADLGTKAVKA